MQGPPPQRAHPRAAVSLSVPHRGSRAAASPLPVLRPAPRRSPPQHCVGLSQPLVGRRVLFSSLCGKTSRAGSLSRGPCHVLASVPAAIYGINGAIVPPAGNLKVTLTSVFLFLRQITPHVLVSTARPSPAWVRHELKP